MKSMNKDLKCADIEYLLFTKELNELTEDEVLSVKEHMKTCKKCRIYQRIVEEFDKALAVPAEGGLVPNSAIYVTALSKMKKRKEKKESAATGVLQFIFDVLRYRIPLYQAAMATAVVVFLSLTINQFTLSDKYREVRISETFQSKAVTVDTVEILKDILKLDSQNVGRNAKEDSFLTQFIYTIM